MAYFPLFIDLSGKTALLVGGGPVAERKMETLLAFGANIRLVSPAVTPGIRERVLSGAATLFARPYRPNDLDGAVLAVTATDDPAVNEQVYRDAVCRKIPVNSADDRAHCTFFFPAIVKRGDVVAGISTGGDAPALAGRIRKRVNTLLPENLDAAAKALGRIRKTVLLEIPDPARRAAILRALTDTALRAAEKEPSWHEDAFCRHLKAAYETMRRGLFPSS